MIVILVWEKLFNVYSTLVQHSLFYSQLKEIFRLLDLEIMDHTRNKASYGLSRIVVMNLLRLTEDPS